MKSFNQYITEETNDANMKYILSNPPYNFRWVVGGDINAAYHQADIEAGYRITVARRETSIGQLTVKVGRNVNYRMIIDVPMFYRTLPAFADAADTAEHMLSNPMFFRDIDNVSIRPDYILVNNLDKFVFDSGTIKKQFEIFNYYETLEGSDTDKLIQILEFIKRHHMVNNFFSHLSIDHLILNVKFSIDKGFNPNMGDWAKVL